MNSDSTSGRRWIPALAAMLAIVAMLIVAPIARADESGASTVQPPSIADSVIYTFGFGSSTGTTCSNLDGAVPTGSLTFANGLLFGRTSTTTGKGNGDGITFHINPDGSGYTIDHLFTGAKTDGSDPLNNSMTLDGTVLYGTTLTGGQHNNGTIFSINDDGTGYSELFSFAKSAQVNPGDQPYSCLALSNGVLYGMTSEGGGKGGPVGFGTIFSFDPETATYTKLHSFNRDGGRDPHGQPIFDPTGSTIYGMTREGGKKNVGVIFSFTPCTPTTSCKNKFKVLHAFACPLDATPTCVDPTDGASPDHGTLVLSGTTLYGVTTAGGASGVGTVFSLSLNGNNEFTVLHDFGGDVNDGRSPFGSLLLNGTTLYGTTNGGGTKSMGTVFQINTDGTNYARVHDFAGGTTDGANPVDNVILVNNTLYGMTQAGGQCNHGVIFAIPLP
jgi:uncharacterized repeat protein (TIGR03803 family)